MVAYLLGTVTNGRRRPENIVGFFASPRQKHSNESVILDVNVTIVRLHANDAQ
jgi:hypothetical protein